jgi:tRNA(Ile)-lysidine synthase
MNKKKTLFQKFIEFNAEKRLANTKKRTLLAVSGGIDSVVMCDLFHKAQFPFAIAHCNFQLRGKDSKADEELQMRSW